MILSLIAAASIPFISRALDIRRKAHDENKDKIDKQSERINQIQGDNRLMSNQIADMQLDIDRFHNRLRKVEFTIVKHHWEEEANIGRDNGG